MRDALTVLATVGVALTCVIMFVYAAAIIRILRDDLSLRDGAFAGALVLVFTWGGLGAAWLAFSSLRS